MHADLGMLINISVAFVAAFIGGAIARRIGLPIMVGYLLTGIAIGPFTPGFVGDMETIRQLAELGVIFLMFGVGLHFSFADLWKVRSVALPGAIGQTMIATLAGYGLSRLWGWPGEAGLVLGLCISVGSTVVLLRGLIDHSLLNTPHGQAAVGWLVMEDILSVLILILMPTLAPSEGGFSWQRIGLTLLKSGLFAGVMFFAGTRLIPWILERVAHTRSRELFILAVLAIALGTALGASELFGVSLALGAFVAGAIVNQSHLSHQVGADVLPFREAFTALFFVSIGMLVNPLFLWQNAGQVVLLTLLIIAGKALITMVLGMVLPGPARTYLVVAIGLSQIGEFSFILGQAGVALNLIQKDQYSLILAGALISISLNPFLYRLLPGLERAVQRMPLIWKRMDTRLPANAIFADDALHDHVVIVGYGQTGKHLVALFESLSVPHLVIDDDIQRVEELNRRGTPALYGDPANSEVITHAGLARARALVITIGDESAAAMIVAAARDIHPQLTIISRAGSTEGMAELSKLGAQRVIYPEMQGRLDMVQYALLELGFPLREVHAYADAVRRDRYDPEANTPEEYHTLSALLGAEDDLEITWFSLPDGSQLAGRDIVQANLRARTGASIVALIRDGTLLANPNSLTVLTPGDRVGLIGELEQVAAAGKIITQAGEDSAG